MSERVVSLAVVGLGYWGPNLARNAIAIPGTRLAWCCEHDADLLAPAADAAKTQSNQSALAYQRTQTQHEALVNQGLAIGLPVEQAKQRALLPFWQSFGQQGAAALTSQPNGCVGLGGALRQRHQASSLLHQQPLRRR